MMPRRSSIKLLSGETVGRRELLAQVVLPLLSLLAFASLILTLDKAASLTLIIGQSLPNPVFSNSVTAIEYDSRFPDIFRFPGERDFPQLSDYLQQIYTDRLQAWSVLWLHEPGFWDQYKWYLACVISLILIQAALLGGLLINRSRHRNAKESLERLRAELEKRVTERTAQLECKTRELETFSYAVAHDLKAPLRGIDGYSRLLLEDYADRLGEEGRSFLRTIRSSTKWMNQLIDDLMDYSRLERRAMTFDSIELRPFVEGVVEEKRFELEQRKIALKININGEIAVADADGLAQVLRNYLDNAIKFTHNCPEPSIEVGAYETEKGCRLWVRDNGAGFDMKFHDRIFEIFQRLHRIEDYPGTGVGLAIVRKSMDRMGGRAWGESTVGQGATFYIEVPKSFERGVLSQASATCPAAPSLPQTINPHQ